MLKSTKGRFFTRLGPGRQLLLITKGRKSGEPRPVGLTYLKDQERWIVVASNAGDHRHPAWWLNLQSEPFATVTVNGQSFPVTATELEEPERTKLLDRFINEIDQAYSVYQQRTPRRLPVISLIPTPL
jgi:deazaflavin-dependent oxidoreductase (nitroreductase family)